MYIKDNEGNDFKVKTCHLRILQRDILRLLTSGTNKAFPNRNPLLKKEIAGRSKETLKLDYLALVSEKSWGPKGVHLSVGFLDNPPTDLKTKILSHMNAWGKTANVSFTETNVSPEVRIARTNGQGHWSYLGKDILNIADNEATMNLDSFTMATPESEFYRVVRHETGHTLGFPHEHMRQEIVSNIDINKAIKYFEQNYRWTKEMTIFNVLTPLEQHSILRTSQIDMNSIMCYHLPESITIDGLPITGGADITESDFIFAAKIYPK